MAYSYKTYSDVKDVMKKFVNATEGSIIYGMGKTTFMNYADKAGAIYKVGESALVNTEIFEQYLQQFRENPRPMPDHVKEIVKVKELKERRR